MAIQSVALMPDREGGNISQRKGAITEIINRRYKQRWRVITTDIQDGPGVVKAASGVPQIGDPYVFGNDTDTISTCVSTDAKATASPYIWYVDVQYDTDRLVDATITNPLNLPPEIQWSGTKYEKPLRRDILGTPVLNSSGEIFDPPVMLEETRPILTIARNEASFNQALAIAYQDATNLGIFAGAAPLVAKMNQFNGVKGIDIGLVYWRVTYEIEFRRETFADFVLDQGFRDINKRLFRDPIDQAPMSSPTLLNGRGARRTDAVTTLTAGVASFDTTIAVASYSAFPPGTPSPPHWYFEVRVDDEVMQVVGGFGTSTWNVLRGYGGTTPAAHSSGATVSLEPYYLRFLPRKILDFSLLNLPVI